MLTNGLGVWTWGICGGRRLEAWLACAILLGGWNPCGAVTPSAVKEPAAEASKTKEAAGEGKKAPATESAAGTPRVALTTPANANHTNLKPDYSIKPGATSAAPNPAEEAIARAIRTIKDCQVRYAKVNDYTCTFYKRELVRGKMTPQFVMAMKARTAPRSIYFKFQEPHKGREAIYVEGRNSGKILVHDVGFTKLLAGTMEIEPTSARAMSESRHPITAAGLGHLIETVVHRWSTELKPDEAIVQFDPDMAIGERQCLMIESIHPRRDPSFQFHKVKLFIDTELGLPIRFEGYDWPAAPGGAADLVEEYNYIDIRLNVGLGDADFDAANRQYSFGRF